ncbi:MAG: hypothetical protein N2111_14290 [Candidatus Sumerlaeaceae bacterium]|nr:hypothetical protein [Candidatus Sumerlaeaceae bacterium]
MSNKAKNVSVRYIPEEQRSVLFVGEEPFGDAMDAILASAELGRTPDKTLLDAVSPDQDYEIKGTLISAPAPPKGTEIDILKTLLDEKNTRPFMRGYYLDAENSAVVAAGGGSLVAHPYKVNGNSRIVGSDGKIIEDKYPDWRASIKEPRIGWTVYAAVTDLDEVARKSLVATKLWRGKRSRSRGEAYAPTDPFVMFRSFGGFVYARPDAVLKTVNAMRGLGNKEAFVFGDKESPVIIFAGDNGTVGLVTRFGHEHYEYFDPQIVAKISVSNDTREKTDIIPFITKQNNFELPDAVQEEEQGPQAPVDKASGEGTGERHSHEDVEPQTDVGEGAGAPPEGGRKIQIGNKFRGKGSSSRGFMLLPWSTRPKKSEAETRRVSAGDIPSSKSPAALSPEGARSRFNLKTLGVSPKTEEVLRLFLAEDKEVTGAREPVRWKDVESASKAFMPKANQAGDGFYEDITPELRTWAKRASGRNELREQALVRAATKLIVRAARSYSQFEEEQKQILKQLERADLPESERKSLLERFDAARFGMLDADLLAGDLLAAVRKTRSATGSLLNSFKMRVPDDAYSAIVRADHIARGRLTPEQRAKAVEIADKYSKAVNSGDIKAISDARIEWALFTRKLAKTPFLEAVMNIRRAGLLTQLRTALTNMGSNATHAIVREVEQNIKGVIDLAVSELGRKSHRSFITTVELVPLLKDIFGLTIDSSKRNIQHIWRYGITINDANKLDGIRRQYTGDSFGNRVIDAYVNRIFDFQTAQDVPFRKFAFFRSLAESALLEAKALMPGDLAGQYNIAKGLLRSPTKSMVVKAIGDAEVSVFASRNELAAAISRFQHAAFSGKSRTAKLAAVMTDFAMPFKNTPFNVWKEIATRATGGGQTFWALMKLLKNKRAGLETRRQYLTVLDLFAKEAVGSALILLGALGFREGVLSGTREMQSERGRTDRDEAAGRQAGSIKIAGKWYSVLPNFSPVSNLLVLGASLERESEQMEKDPDWTYTQLSDTTLKTFADVPFAQGLKDIAETFEEGNIAGYAGRAAASFIPSAVSLSQMFDPTRRESKPRAGDPYSNYLLQPAKARLPFIKQNVRAKVNAFGEEMRGDPYTFFRPYYPQEALEDKSEAVRELIRLDVPVVAAVKRRDEPDLYFEIKRRTQGKVVLELLERLVSNPVYKNMDDERKRKALERAVDRGKEMGSVRAAHEFARRTGMSLAHARLMEAQK